MSNSAPGFKERPEYRIVTRPAGVRVRVAWRGETLADSREAILLEETGYRPVYYLPRKDVRMERLQRSSHATRCPYKGTASYYSVAGGPDNAAWTYETPYDEMQAIRGLLAFYRDQVEIRAGEA